MHNANDSTGCGLATTKNSGWPCLGVPAIMVFRDVMYRRLAAPDSKVAELVAWARAKYPFWNRTARAGQARHFWLLPCDHGPGDCAYSRPHVPFKYALREMILNMAEYSPGVLLQELTCLADYSSFNTGPGCVPDVRPEAYFRVWVWECVGTFVLVATVFATAVAKPSMLVRHVKL